MGNPPSFADVVDAADALSPEEQEELVSIICRRLAEEGRRRVAADVAEGRAEYDAGRCRPMSVQDIMQRARSWRGN